MPQTTHFMYGTTSTYRADAFTGVGLTKEAQITAAIAAAVADGVQSVFVPQSMLPYNASLVTFNNAVQMMCEGSSQQQGVYDARAYGGTPNAWRAIGACATNLPSTGGIIDCRGFVGSQVADNDCLGGVTVEKPIKFIFGPSTWSCQQGNSAVIMSLFGSGIVVELNNTTFILNDGTNQSYMFFSDQTAGVANASVTNASATVTLAANPSRGVVPSAGKAIAIAGHTPNGGRDNTTLNGAIDGVTTTIVLTSVAAQLATNGWIRIDNEIISYTSFSGSTLVGVVRGAFGSTAAAHLNLANVERVVYNSYLIKTVSGLTLTLDSTVTLAPTMTAVPALIGPADCSFTGTGVLDGGRPAGDVAANGIAIQGWGSTRLKVERGITIKNWDHGGVALYQSQYASVDGSFYNIGTAASNLGFSVLFFQGSKFCTAYGDYERVNLGPACDDRTTTPQVYDNTPQGCIFMPRVLRNVGTGVKFEGTSRSYALVPYIDAWGADSSPAAAVFTISAPQWATAATGLGNYVDVGFCNPTGQIGSIASGNQNMIVVVRTPAATVLNSGGETNVILTVGTVGGVNYGLIQNNSAAIRSATSGVQTRHNVTSPDGNTNFYARVYDSGAATVPVKIGASSNDNMSWQINATDRWVLDTLGRFKADTTNGGSRLERSIALVSGTTPAIDASQGNLFTLAVLTNIAAVIAVPSNPPAAGLSQEIDILIRNSSGGALATAPTFNGAANGFKFSAVTNMGNGTAVLYRFRWDPTTSFWIEVDTHLAAGL